MKVRIRYSNNRLDAFDTDTFTKSEPFAGTSMLTNFELRMDLLGESGLWLEAHHYDANASYSEQSDSDETPIARRKRGWKFLLAEASEIADIESVSLDGEIMLQRILGELVDIMKLDEQCHGWVSGSQSLSATDKLLELYQAIAPTEETGDAEEVARACGCSFSLIKALQAMRPEEDEETEEDQEDSDEDWMEGFEYEDID